MEAPNLADYYNEELNAQDAPSPVPFALDVETSSALKVGVGRVQVAVVGAAPVRLQNADLSRMAGREVKTLKLVVAAQLVKGPTTLRAIGKAAIDSALGEYAERVIEQMANGVVVRVTGGVKKTYELDMDVDVFEPSPVLSPAAGKDTFITISLPGEALRDTYIGAHSRRVA